VTVPRTLLGVSCRVPVVVVNQHATCGDNSFHRFIVFIFKCVKCSPGGGGKLFAFRDFSSLRTHFRSANCNRRRVYTRFRLLKYCSSTPPSVENCDSPTLRLGEVLDFSISFWPRHLAAWPVAFQVMFKNKAGSSLFELLCDVFSKNFQSSMPFVWFFGLP
jgi:hypothetical protein